VARLLVSKLSSGCGASASNGGTSCIEKVSTYSLTHFNGIAVTTEADHLRIELHDSIKTTYSKLIQNLNLNRYIGVKVANWA